MKRIVIVVGIILVATVTGCGSATIVTNKQGIEVTVKCQPIYGNWCGGGYPAYEVTGYRPEPVDVWDEACMEHDFCYDKYGVSGKENCDEIFSRKLEHLDRQGIPAPHQAINAYNYFKKNKPYRQINISFKDIWDVNTLSCRGDEGIPTVFCDVGRGRDNCEISMGFKMEGARCFCDYPTLSVPFGVIPGGRLWGYQKTANGF